MQQHETAEYPLLPSMPQRALRVWGIDLGTTNSTVAEIVWNPEDPALLPSCRCLEIEQTTTDGVYTGPLVPSVLAILPSGEHWIGEGAKRLRARPQEMALTVEKNLFYETKNDMGLRRSYHRAPAAYIHASKIAGHILRFLAHEAARANGDAAAKADSIVVTVPASFLLNQRRDTLHAAESAGLSLGDHGLLDEPIAALTDYLFTHPDQNLASQGENTLAVVFDFGGGTCDVAVVEIQPDADTRRLRISPRSVSRYHRLGGGDLDAAIVHEILIPALVAENGLSPHDLTWVEKKKAIEPQLLGTAEALKIMLCREIDRLRKFGRYESADRTQVAAHQPKITCTVQRREYTIARPTLTAQQWEHLLESFLDSDFLFARETEYRLTQSIFAPLDDALRRSGLEPGKVGFCLLIGGSTLIPQVQDAIKSFFHSARVVGPGDPLTAQTAVARGAAWHAFYLAANGCPLIQTVTHDGIALLTGDGVPFPLIPEGSALPYPADGNYAVARFAMPRALVRALKMDVVTLSSRQPILQETWEIEHLVSAGDEIVVEYRLSAAHEFECRAFLADQTDAGFVRVIENPFCAVSSPGAIRLQIEEVEEDLRQHGGNRAEDAESYVRLARWYAELRQTEKAIDYLKTALRLLPAPSAEILNQMGIYFGELGDYSRQEKAYREADSCSPVWGGSLFNLALSFRKQKRIAEALAAVEQAKAKDGPNGPHLTLKAMCLEEGGQPEEAKRQREAARLAFRPLTVLSDWELGWLDTCLHGLGDAAARAELEQERTRRKNAGSPAPADDRPERPIVMEPTSLARRE